MLNPHAKLGAEPLSLASPQAFYSWTLESTSPRTSGPFGPRMWRGLQDGKSGKLQLSILFPRQQQRHMPSGTGVRPRGPSGTAKRIKLVIGSTAIHI